MHSSRVRNIQGYWMLFPLFIDPIKRSKIVEMDVILITPSWQAQPWCSQVLELSVTELLLPPQLSNNLVNSQGQVHPLIVNRTLRLVTWIDSGKVCPQKELRKELQSLSQVPEDQVHHLITNRPGVNGLADAVNGKSIGIHAILTFY